ncbi:MAG TPA: RNA polymerase-binding protein DksA [Campylobacteraceae bacterium]|nr:RNA polymerase-binding protein DksA [Campylobacteraceae bacterium]
MTEKETNEFREMLLKRKEEIEKTISDKQQEISSLTETDASDEADFATISTDSEMGHTINTRLRNELQEIEYALFKISNHTYGICEMCEEPIGIARLKVKPQARYCIVCREIVEKS